MIFHDLNLFCRLDKDIEMLETFQTNEQKLIEIFEEKEKLIEQNEKDFESTVQQIEEKYKLDKERFVHFIFKICISFFYLS